MRDSTTRADFESSTMSARLAGTNLDPAGEKKKSSAPAALASEPRPVAATSGETRRGDDAAGNIDHPATDAHDDALRGAYRLQMQERGSAEVGALLDRDLERIVPAIARFDQPGREAAIAAAGRGVFRNAERGAEDPHRVVIRRAPGAVAEAKDRACGKRREQLFERDVVRSDARERPATAQRHDQVRESGRHLEHGESALQIADTE